jgi:outer membrane protein TolC
MAQAGRRKAEAELRAEQQFIARTVELAWQTYDSQRLAVSALLGEAQSAADEALKAKLSAYAAGEVSLFDVLEARRAAQAVETSTLDARRTAAEAWLDLGRAVGTYSFSTPDHPVTAPVGDQP